MREVRHSEQGTRGCARALLGMTDLTLLLENTENNEGSSLIRFVEKPGTDWKPVHDRLEACPHGLKAVLPLPEQNVGEDKQPLPQTGQVFAENFLRGEKPLSRCRPRSGRCRVTDGRAIVSCLCAAISGAWNPAMLTR